MRLADQVVVTSLGVGAGAGAGFDTGTEVGVGSHGGSDASVCTYAWEM